MVLMSWEECGMVAEPCLDAGNNPHTSEVTYQVRYERVAPPWMRNAAVVSLPHIKKTLANRSTPRFCKIPG